MTPPGAGKPLRVTIEYRDVSYNIEIAEAAIGLAMWVDVRRFLAT